MKTILVTRAEGKHFKDELSNIAASLDFIPLIETHPSTLSKDDVETLLALKAGAFKWLVFTSENGVRWGTLALRANEIQIPENTKILAQGPQTADSVRELLGRKAVMPDAFVAEEVLRFLESRLKRDESVLCLVASKTRNVIERGLRKLKINVARVAVYETQSRDLTEEEKGRIRDHLCHSYIVVFSPSAVHALVKQFPDEAKAASFVSIGPITSAAITEVGAHLVAESPEHTEEGLVKLLKPLLTPR